VAKGVQGSDRMESVPDSPWLPDMGSHPSRPQGSPAGTTDSIPRHQYCGPTDDQTQQCTFAECAMARPASRWPLMGAIRVSGYW